MSPRRRARFPWSCRLALPAGLGLAAALLGGCGEAYRTGFESDPFAAGWAWGKPAWAKKAREKGRARVTAPGVDGRGQALTVQSGMWRSPPLTLRPLGLYRLTFRARSDARGYWGVLSYDAAGEEIPASVYSAYAPADSFRLQVGDVLVPAGAVRSRILFWPREAPVAVDEVRLAAVSPAAVRRRADELYAQLPPLQTEPDPDRWQHLPRTRARLAGGEELRLVLLGDSVANDAAQSHVHLLLERAWPGSRVVLHNEVGSGARAGAYLEEGALAARVLPHRPHLVLLGGMSGRAEDIPALVELAGRLREAGAEFAVFTGTLLTPRYWGDFERQHARRAAYRRALRKAAGPGGFAVLDIGRDWEAYLRRSELPVEFFRRDSHHANEFGKQIYGRLLAAWLTDES
jgi:hypothetical protein